MYDRSDVVMVLLASGLSWYCRFLLAGYVMVFFLPSFRNILMGCIDRVDFLVVTPGLRHLNGRRVGILEERRLFDVEHVCFNDGDWAINILGFPSCRCCFIHGLLAAPGSGDDPIR